MKNGYIDPIFTRGASLEIPQFGSFGTEIVRNLAEAFFRNFEDIQRLLNIPLAMTSQGIIAGRLSPTAFVNFLIHISPPERRAEVENLRKREMLDQRYARELIHNIANDPVRALPELHALGADDVLNFVAADSGAQTNLRHLLSFSISAGWTAFDSMLMDLWNGIGEEGCKILASHARASQKSKKRGGEALLKALSKFRPLFDTTIHSNTKELERLEAHRNVIHHRGGRADALFIEQTQVQIREGELIELTGANTTKMLNSAIATGTALLLQADNWLRTPGLKFPKASN